MRELRLHARSVLAYMLPHAREHIVAVASDYAHGQCRRVHGAHTTRGSGAEESQSFLDWVDIDCAACSSILHTGPILITRG